MLETVKNIVLDAAKLLEDGDYAVHQKGRADFVTDKDIAVEQYIRARVRSDIPDCGFIGEEGERAADALARTYTAVVDPIDGTMNFMRGYRMSAISFALLHFGKPYIGVVYNPDTKELFCAEAGKGATLNGVPIRVSDLPLEKSIFFTAWCTYHKEHAEVCISVMREVFPDCCDIRRFGVCSYELCAMAAGRGELYFEILLYPWDYAAASLIFTEAGGYIGTLGGKAPTFDRPQPIIAANSAQNFAYLCEKVKKYVPTVPYGG